MKMYEVSIKISLKFVLKVRINNIPALVQIMAWCQPGHKPLSEPMMVSLLTQICITRLQWVNIMVPYIYEIWTVNIHEYIFYHDMQISWPDSSSTPIRLPGWHLNIKMSSYQYMDPHVKDIRRSRNHLIFNMGIPIPGKDRARFQELPVSLPVMARVMWSKQKCAFCDVTYQMWHH